jgi:hypothetical protein
MTKFKSLAVSILVAVTSVITSYAQSTFQLPQIEYAYDALEPSIDQQTMLIHHTKHHQGYSNNLNKALEGTPALNLTFE